MSNPGSGEDKREKKKKNLVEETDGFKLNLTVLKPAFAKGLSEPNSMSKEQGRILIISFS